MKMVQKIVGSLILGAAVMMAPGSARADDPCVRTAPDCEGTMGLCGAYCSSCWMIDYENYQYPYEWCDWMCADYGGTVNVIAGNSGTSPDYMSVLCHCAQECPYYY